MIPAPTPYGTVIPGTIGILTYHGESCDELNDWLDLMVRQYPQIYLPRRLKGTQIAAQRNVLAREFRGEWLLYVDADNIPSLDTLPRLLAHQVPIVGGVILERTPPFRICAVKALEPTVRFTLAELPGEGLVPTVAVGTGCLLIHRRVFETMAYPWFRVGKLDPEFLSEDFEFGMRANEVGFQSWLDAGVRVGHKSYGILYPGKDKQVWVRWPGSADIREPITERATEFSQDEVHEP